MNRSATVTRQTKETRINVSVNIDGTGDSEINVPIKFLGHMFDALARHSGFDLRIDAEGDMEIDQHHTVEDLGIVLGQAFKKALGDRKGIYRAGFFIYPMDEALAMVAVDISGRPYLQFEADFRRRFCGDFDTDLTKHFFEAFANGFGANVVIRLMAGENDHHKLEAIFKALAKSLRMACVIDRRMEEEIPSTKGVIE